MKIAVISDTHDNKEAINRLVEQIKAEKIEFIIHAGDHISPFTIEWLSKASAKIFGVAGNNDGEKELLMKKYLEKGWGFSYSTLTVNLSGGITIYHGTDQKLVEALIKSGLYKVIISGHTHRPLINYYDNDVLHLNPGEACGYLTGKRTYAILRMPEKTVEIIEF